MGNPVAECRRRSPSEVLGGSDKVDEYPFIRYLALSKDLDGPMPYTGTELEKNREMLASLSPDQVMEMYRIEREAIARYNGTIDELEAAIGVLHVGYHLGWKPLVLIHNKRTLRKYEEILGINMRDQFPEEGPSAERSMGYKVAKRIGSFWKAVSGELKDEELKQQRREVV